MAIKFKLGEIMAREGLKNKDVVEKTTISRNTITALQGGAIRRIDFDTLDRLCRGLDLKPEDLIEYIPDPDE